MGTKKTEEKEPERFYAGGFYLTKIDDHTYKVPQGLVDQFSRWNETHTGLQKMLEGLASYVAEQRGLLYRQQNEFWNTITDAIGLPRGSNATIDNMAGKLNITPYADRVAVLKVEIVDKVER